MMRCSLLVGILDRARQRGGRRLVSSCFYMICPLGCCWEALRGKILRILASSVTDVSSILDILGQQLTRDDDRSLLLEGNYPSLDRNLT